MSTTQLSLKAIWSRSLKSAEETAKLLPGDHSPVDLYSSDSGEGKAFDDILKRTDIKGLIIALPIADQGAYIEKVNEAYSTPCRPSIRT